MSGLKSIVKVGTHDGVFHIDEIAAIAILKTYFENVDIVRTRDKNKLDDCDILVDIGRKYDGKRFFDHHQFKEGDKLYGLSSAGLVAKSFPVDNKFHDFISAIDKRDTRVGYDDNEPINRFFDLVSDCNALNVHSEEQNKTFLWLVELFTAFFKGNISFDEIKGQIKDFADKNREAKEREFMRRINDIVPIEIDGIKIARLKEVVPSKFIKDDYHASLRFDDRQQAWLLISTDTDRLKILDISDKVFVHANGFIGVSKSNDKINAKVKFRGEEKDITINLID